jgi:hypothetical protein
MGKLLDLVTLPQHIPCCSHFQLYIHYFIVFVHGFQIFTNISSKTVTFLNVTECLYSLVNYLENCTETSLKK